MEGGVHLLRRVREHERCRRHAACADGRGAGGLGATMVASAVMLVVLYLCCRWYRSYKRAHPEIWARFF